MVSLHSQTGVFVHPCIGFFPVACHSLGVRVGVNSLSPGDDPQVYEHTCDVVRLSLRFGIRALSLDRMVIVLLLHSVVCGEQDCVLADDFCTLKAICLQPSLLCGCGWTSMDLVVLAVPIICFPETAVKHTGANLRRFNHKL